MGLSIGLQFILTTDSNFLNWLNILEKVDKLFWFGIFVLQTFWTSVGVPKIEYFSIMKNLSSFLIFKFSSKSYFDYSHIANRLHFRSRERSFSFKIINYYSQSFKSITCTFWFWIILNDNELWRMKMNDRNFTFCIYE